jgi:hypothetical protein
VSKPAEDVSHGGACYLSRDVIQTPTNIFTCLYFSRRRRAL